MVLRGRKFLGIRRILGGFCRNVVWWRWLLAGLAVLVVWGLFDVVKRIGVWESAVWAFIVVLSFSLWRFVAYVRNESG